MILTKGLNAMRDSSGMLGPIACDMLRERVERDRSMPSELRALARDMERAEEMMAYQRASEPTHAPEQGSDRRAAALTGGPLP